jgi:glycosyltransferase involved in cell wall biosynthesis
VYHLFQVASISKALNVKDIITRILQVIPVFSAQFGGPVTVVRSISKELAKQHEVTVYTTSALDQRHDFKDSPFEVESDGYHVAYFPRVLTFNGFNVSLGMARALKENLSQYDVVHLHSWRHFQDIIVHHYAKKYRVPYVLQAHGSLPRIVAKQRLKWVYDVFFGYKLLRDASKMIALTQIEAQQYKNVGVPEKKIEVIPNGIDLSEYSNLPAKGSFKNRFSIDDDEKIVLYVGRIHESKGIDFLIKSFANLVRGGEKDVKLVLVGPDDGYLKVAKKLVYLLGISSDVLFTGFLTEEAKFSAYVDSTVVVYPSQFEPFGLVSLEAAVFSKPIIMAKGTPISKVIEKGKFGFSIKYGDVEELVETLNLIIGDDELSSKLGMRGRQYVSKNFSIEESVSKLEKLYKMIKVECVT